jgi:dGTPase
MMNWRTLLSRKRLGRTGEGVKRDTERSAFQRDFDRIVFSSAFRLLQDKTQVFPLPDSDYVRTRLTHSLETSCVGRSLGTLVGQALVERHQLEPEFHPSDFGAIVAAACLAHDIGNPPFGHSGEDCIRHWFLTSDVVAGFRDSAELGEHTDLARFEGNAQGFRVLSHIQNPQQRGGMQLTCTTLAAFMKYPQESRCLTDESIAARYRKKYGFFQREKDRFAIVAEEVGLIQCDDFSWVRHPLTFLVEAADDVCYYIIDFEDGYHSRLISYEEIRDRFMAVIETGPMAERARAKLDSIETTENRVEYLRSLAISTVVNQVQAAFLDREPEILSGEFNTPLTDVVEAAKALDVIKRQSINDIYAERGILEIESAGFVVIPGLLDAFLGAITNNDLHSRKVRQLLPSWYQQRDSSLDSEYARVLNITDYISSLTDSSAVSLYKKIKGISLS